MDNPMDEKKWIIPSITVIDMTKKPAQRVLQDSSLCHQPVRPQRVEQRGGGGRPRSHRHHHQQQ